AVVETSVAGAGRGLGPLATQNGPLEIGGTDDIGSLPIIVEQKRGRVRAGEDKQTIAGRKVKRGMTITNRRPAQNPLLSLAGNAVGSVQGEGMVVGRKLAGA